MSSLRQDKDDPTSGGDREEEDQTQVIGSNHTVASGFS